MTYQINPKREEDEDNGDPTSATTSADFGFSSDLSGSANTSSSLPSMRLRIEQEHLNRIRHLENQVSELQYKISELTHPSDSVEIFEVVGVTVEEAEKAILEYSKGKDKVYLSDIVEDTHMDPEKLYKAFKKLLKKGKIEKK